MQPDRTRWNWDLWLATGGFVVAAAGAVLLGGSLRQQTASFGWFAYAPLSTTMTVSVDNGPRAAELFGYGLAVVGLLVVAWTLGYRRSPRAGKLFLAGAPLRTRTLLGMVAGMAVLLALAGGSLLATAPPTLPLGAPRAEASTEMSMAHSSELALSFDADHGPLLVPALALLVGGLLVSATALGRRSGRAGQGTTP